MAKKIGARPFVLQRFLFAGLRKLSRFYPIKGDALKEARVAPNTYICNICKKKFSRGEVVVDHIDPVIEPKTGFQTWDIYIARLFCPAKGLQVLCKSCHTAKSSEENAIRRQRRKGRQDERA